ncbi:unnamed protein product [Didymodactylos carnosus]|uniref:Uncharacterized protein n=2 Tax=Didymodactylos carnosus TaxID=1234261 RepID=A0A816BHJ5_9BILA|nr:unnamed protein product [Didymodactylos carnosus]CAF4491495.1 unnamed protein product [Didymodactylos carnosus]
MDFDFVADHIQLVWVDKNMEDYRRTQEKFRQNTDTLATFNNAQYCIDFIRQNSTKKIFLITQGLFARDIVPQVENCDQLECVYIFCHNVQNYRDWALDYDKIMKGGIFDIDDDLNISLTKGIRDYLLQATMDLQNKANRCLEKAQELTARYRELYQAKCTLHLSRPPDVEDPAGMQPQ